MRLNLQSSSDTRSPRAGFRTLCLSTGKVPLELPVFHFPPLLCTSRTKCLPTGLISHSIQGYPAALWRRNQRRAHILLCTWLTETPACLLSIFPSCWASPAGISRNPPFFFKHYLLFPLQVQPPPHFTPEFLEKRTTCERRVAPPRQGGTFSYGSLHASHSNYSPSLGHSHRHALSIAEDIIVIITLFDQWCSPLSFTGQPYQPLLQASH